MRSFGIASVVSALVAGLLLAVPASAPAQMMALSPPCCSTYAPCPAPTAPTPTTPAPGVPSPAPSTPQTPAPSTLPGTPQDQAANEPQPSDISNQDTTPTATFDSAVGYIDEAIPVNQLRIRYDAAYRSNRPNRAEFIYAQGAPFGPGLPLPETRIDYQELVAHGECLLLPDLSVFIDAPIHDINPEVNASHTGFSDLQAGFKYAFYRSNDQVTTFQFKVFTPTGDVERGLGTGHVSLEPALLHWHRLTDRLIMEAELHAWTSVGGSDFAGDVVRYGIGFSYGERPPDKLWIVPVIEFVGWTVVNGQESAPGIETKSSDGDTIVNGKFGFRVGYGNHCDLYTGYGRALTGEVWYKELWRTEVRFIF